MTPLYPGARDLTLKAEGPGGTVEPGDAGLLTVYGITMGYDSTWSGWSIYQSLIKNGASYATWTLDPALLGAVDAFYAGVWAEAKMDLFSDQALANSYFGGYVNEGPKVAHFLQEVVGVVQDGILGADTMNAILAHGVDRTLAEFKLARVYYYDKTASIDDLRGLINRVKMGA